MKGVEQKKKLIYILEDNCDHAEMYQDMIGRLYQVKCFETYENFVTAIDEKIPDFAFLDLHLQQQNLFDICDFDFSFPFAIITGYADEKYHKQVKQVGGTNMLVKPVDQQYLIWEINTAIALAEENKKNLSVCPIKIDINSTSCVVGKDRISLSRKEFSIINYLIKNYPEPVRRKALIEVVWPNELINEKTLYTHFYNLGKKFENTKVEFHYKNNQIYLRDRNEMEE